MNRLRRRESAAVEFAAFRQCRLASRLDLAPKWERPYSWGMSWVPLRSPFVIIHAVDLRLRGRHRRSVFGFSAASNRLFFFNWPLGLNRVCLDSAKCSIYFSCWAASIFCQRRFSARCTHTHTYCCTSLRITCDTHAHLPCSVARLFWVFLLCLCWVINNSALLIILCTTSFLHNARRFVGDRLLPKANTDNSLGAASLCSCHLKVSWWRPPNRAQYSNIFAFSNMPEGQDKSPVRYI